MNVSALIGSIRGRALEDGGFSESAGGEYRPEATAWAVLSLGASGREKELLGPSRTRLAGGQGGDGRVSVSPDHPEAFWPTSLAVLAWHGSRDHKEFRSRAIRFLMNAHGAHFPKDPDSPAGHDSSIRGWPWIENTHSWVEPTSLAVIAFTISGHGEHERAREAVRMIVDRQLPRGGWNYGNTIVYGKELYPQPDVTGIALCALAGHVERSRVQESLGYLSGRIDGIRTPLSLGWGILGLASWGLRPGKADARISDCLKRQEKFGSYPTTLLSLLLFASAAGEGPVRALSGAWKDGGTAPSA